MFRVVYSPIVRSTHNCIYGIWHLSNRHCYLPLSWKSWNCLQFREGLIDLMFLRKLICLLCLVYQGSLNIIIYFYFPILKELMIYVSCCFISIGKWLLVVKCYSSLVVSGFSRNEFNSCILFNLLLFY